MGRCYVKEVMSRWTERERQRQRERVGKEAGQQTPLSLFRKAKCSQTFRCGANMIDFLIWWKLVRLWNVKIVTTLAELMK